MDRADQSVTRHAAASRAAYETLYTAFASQPGGIKESHRSVLQSLQAELRLDQTFADGVATRHESKRQRTLRGSSSSAGGGHSGDEKSGGGGGSGGGLGDGGLLNETPGIQIAWKEVRGDDCFFSYHTNRRLFIIVIDCKLRWCGERI